MHPAFASIRFGPFKSDYHEVATVGQFREGLNDYLVRKLLPQVDEPFTSTTGALQAVYDDQKYCGPNSAVRDLYRLEFEFQRSSGNDSIKLDLAYSPATYSFAPRYRGTTLHLWTKARKAAQEEQNVKIEAVCQQILHNEFSVAKCPVCDADLTITNSPALFDVLCPTGCFKYNFHRDPATGEFQHGHFFRSPT